MNAKKDSIELPIGWVQTTVGNVCSEINSGSGFPKNTQGQSEGEHPFAKVGDISRKFRAGLKSINSADHYISEEVRVAIKAKLFPSESIVFPKIGEALKNNYRLITKRRMLFDNNVMGLTPSKDCVQSDFLYYFLTTQDFGKFSVATAVPSIRRGDVESIPLFLPSLNEQGRIVTKIETLLSELDKGIEALKTARAQLKVYRQAVLKHAFEGKLTACWRAENPDKLETQDQLLARFQHERETRYQQQLKDWKVAIHKLEEEKGEKGENRKPSKPKKPKKPEQPTPVTEYCLEIPDSWTSITLGDLNVEVFDGPFGSNLKSSDYVESGIRVIRLENIGYLQFIEGKYSFVTDEKYSTLVKHTVYVGDLIFSSFITEGIRVAVLPETVNKSINKADCFCVRLHGKSYRNDFLANYLSTRGAYKQIEEDIHGVGRPRINTTQLKGFVVPVCSQAEQAEVMRQIELRLSVAELTNTEISAELSRIESLKQSILKKAFSGQLVSQVPNDEPASTLVNCINNQLDH